MNKKKAAFTLIASVLLVFCGFAMVHWIHPKNEVKLVESESYFSDFEVVENKVYVKCSLTLKNTCSTEKKVTVSAIMSEDVQTGLLKNAVLPATDMHGIPIEYTILPKSKKTFDVIFIGDFAGTLEKSNHLLPQIKVDILQ